MSDSNVSIQISKEIVNPIVEAKIKDMIVEALGGKDRLIENVVSNVLGTKVDSTGKVSSYSYDNKFSWIEFYFSEQIRDLVREEMKIVIKEQATLIKGAIAKQLRTQKGINSLASALINAMDKTLENAWTSDIKIEFNQKK